MRNKERIRLIEANQRENLANYNAGRITRAKYMTIRRDGNRRITELKAEK